MLPANFPETSLEDEPNRQLSTWVAECIRQRVNDPTVAEKLNPRDHGLGMKRLPIETNYSEAYNRDNAHPVDLQETPIGRISTKGTETSDRHYGLDLIIYTTGFEAVTGGLNRIDITGADGLALREKWNDWPNTYLGMMMHGFPNMLMCGRPAERIGGNQLTAGNRDRFGLGDADFATCARCRIQPPGTECRRGADVGRKRSRSGKTGCPSAR